MADKSLKASIRGSTDSPSPPGGAIGDPVSHVRLYRGGPALARSQVICAVCETAVPWEGEKFAVLRYIALTEGAINAPNNQIRRFPRLEDPGR